MNPSNSNMHSHIVREDEYRAGAAQRRAGQLFQKDLTPTQRKLGLIAVLGVIAVAVVVLFVFF